jgi:hypothetical protein
MVRLVIEVDTREDLELAVEHVVGLVYDGFTEGYYPTWHIEDPA